MLRIPALKVFLNASTQLSGTLLLKFLSTLRSIQKWAGTQTTLRLYSSSILLVYDAEWLKSRLYSQRNYSFKGNPSSSFQGPSSDGSPSETRIKPKLSCITEDIVTFQYTGQSVNNSRCVDENSFHDQKGNNSNQNGDCDSSNSIQLYKQLERCNSTKKNIEEVRKLVIIFHNPNRLPLFRI